MAAAAGLTSRRGSSSSPTGYGFTDRQMPAALEEVIERRDDGDDDLDRAHDREARADRFPTIAVFQRTRIMIIEEELAAGKARRPFPSQNTLYRRWGSWPKVEAAYRAYRREEEDQQQLLVEKPQEEPKHHPEQQGHHERQQPEQPKDAEG